MGIYAGKKKVVVISVDIVSSDHWISSDHWGEYCVRSISLYYILAMNVSRDKETMITHIYEPKDLENPW
jgi:hypothetical protein